MQSAVSNAGIGAVRGHRRRPGWRREGDSSTGEVGLEPVSGMVVDGLMTLAEAAGWLEAHHAGRAPETARLRLAAGRVLAADVVLQRWPPHATAATCGVAVLAAATEGASAYAPVAVAGVVVRAGDAMPAGTDAVLPAHGMEGGGALMAVGRGAGVHPPGHDAAEGAVLPAGTVLTPLHLALLPGDPLVRPLARVAVAAPRLCGLLALVAAAGAVVTAGEPDLVLLAERPGSGAGWVAGAEGIAMQPGEATAIGLMGGVPAIVLPRHLADAATVFALLAAPVLRRIGGLPEPEPVQATLSRKITSSLGLLEAVRVRVAEGRARPLGPADGIGLLAAAAANGLVLVPEGSEGYPGGTVVPIYPL